MCHLLKNCEHFIHLEFKNGIEIKMICRQKPTSYRFHQTIESAKLTYRGSNKLPLIWTANQQITWLITFVILRVPNL